MICNYASSGCNGPKEGECIGLCMHRVPIQMEHYSREPKVYKLINWLCAVIFVGLVPALWTGVLK